MCRHGLFVMAEVIGVVLLPSDRMAGPICALTAASLGQRLRVLLLLSRVAALAVVRDVVPVVSGD